MTRTLYLEELSLREMVVGILDTAPVSAFMDLSINKATAGIKTYILNPAYVVSLSGHQEKPKSISMHLEALSRQEMSLLGMVCLRTCK